MTNRLAQAFASLRKRLKSQAGFSMSEMLAATAILVVLGSVVVTALPTAAQVVKRATYTSNADVLASSVNTALSDMLRYASLYVDEEGNVLTDAATASPLFKPASSYVDANGRSVEMGYLALVEGRVRIVPIVGGVDQAPTPVPRSTGIYTDFSVDEFHVDFVPDASATATSMVGVYEGTYTLVSNDGTFAKQVTFTCRPLTTETVPV